MYRSTPSRELTSTRRLLGKLTKYIKIYFVIKPLQSLFPSKPLEQKLEHMRSLPENTVGHDLAKMLDSRGLMLIPGFGKHDLNHLILGYDMQPEDELCMQAYLIGNGHWQPQCFLFFSSAVLLPGLWRDLWTHFQMGRRTKCISRLQLDKCMEQDTEQLRRLYAPSHANIVADRGEARLCSAH